MLNKVPQITLVFWIIKVLTTGMGEAASDWALNMGDGIPGLGLAVTLGLDVVLFVGALVWQLAVRRYIPAVYWLAVAAVAVFGTGVADILAYVVGVPLWLFCTVAAIAIGVNFAVWHAREQTLSIHAVDTRRRERFYWTTVFLTFALGTSLGDLSASAWHLGFLGSGILFAVVIAVPAVAYRLGANGTLTFWAAYIVTRPLGASFADWFSVSPAEGGLGLGAGPVALVATVVIVGLVVYVTRQQRVRADQPLDDHRR
ncbi:MAG: COG4705 family protein [Janthinobacterium lividum]